MNHRPKDSTSYALITGASSGMGREYARQLFADGHNLIIISKTKAKLDLVEQELKKNNDPKIDVIAICLDLSQPSAADTIFEQVGDKRVDILINNAGVMDYTDFLTMPIDRASDTIILHNYTLVRLCHLFGNQMKERSFGYILNISSLASWMPYPGLAIYAASKRFNKSFSRSLRIELMGSGVSVTTAYFGGVATDLFTIKENLLRLALKTHILIPAEKASRIALRAMFNRRANVLPGVINWLALPFLPIIPKRLLHFVDKKILTRIKM